MKKLKLVLKLISVFSLFIILLIAISNISVEVYAKNKVFNSTKEIPYNKVGLVLGTSKYLSNGYINYYYKNRIEAAVKLFKSGKIDYILVSGDNGNKYYDEPSTFKNDLIAAGIPANKIYLDYAGFRTLDSIIRSKKVFGQSKITVISQQFHNERAIFIGRFKGVDVIGYNAKSVGRYYGAKTKIREVMARVKMTLDLIFAKKPKFLGEEVEIG